MLLAPMLGVFRRYADPGTVHVVFSLVRQDKGVTNIDLAQFHDGASFPESNFSC